MTEDPGGAADRGRGGRRFGAADALIVKTLTMKAGDTVQVTYERNGASHTTELTLAAE